MKKLLSVLILICLLTGLAPACLAATTYVIQSSEPQGYLYLYDKPSSSGGNNLGAYYNDTTVSVVTFNAKNGFALVRTPDGRKGYMNNKYLYTFAQINSRRVYTVNSTDPAGYCYMYDQPNDVKGSNIGYYPNGSRLQVIDYDADKTFAYCRSEDDGLIGYVRKACITLSSTIAIEGYAQVDSVDPMGYCYMYDQPNDVKGKNLGRYDDGFVFDVLEWDASKTYALVRDGDTDKTGYVRKTCLNRWY